MLEKNKLFYYVKVLSLSQVTLIVLITDVL